MASQNAGPAGGFREVEHTADWALEVWAPSLEALLEQAARGMYALARTRLKPEPRVTRTFTLPFEDPETLLVDFLNELLYLEEVEGLGFDTFHLRLQNGELKVQVEGAPIEGMEKLIKAATFHNLRIEQRPEGWWATVVFDV